MLPAGSAARADVRALANAIACDIHPLNNTRVLKYITGELGVSEEDKLTWYRHWITLGFSAIETGLAVSSDGRYCFGDSPGMADVLLVPQVYNARRFEVDMSPFPLIGAINDHCLTLDAFARAAPENQPDAT